ncbi:hypothetical protein KEF29_17895 [Streptomyces tuirus]|uniref:Uncharacterized protein n=1 Tax=Streptomyces tuirus TaxID=68278 RepID=A0A941FAP4_9ACTN|nr:hypothetical protein [Streptomyces tuirus]
MLTPISPTSFSPHESTTTLLGNAPGHSYLVVFTYWHQVKPEDIDRLNRLHHVKMTMLFTYSGIDNKDIEPYPSDVAAESLKLMSAPRERQYRTVLWRRGREAPATSMAPLSRPVVGGKVVFAVHKCKPCGCAAWPARESAGKCHLPLLYHSILTSGGKQQVNAAQDTST